MSERASKVRSEGGLWVGLRFGVGTVAVVVGLVAVGLVAVGLVAVAINKLI